MQNTRFNWLEHGKNLSPIKRTGRKMFDVRKNNQSIRLNDDIDRKSLTPTRYRIQLENSKSGITRNHEKRYASNIRLDPIGQEGLYKKLVEKEKEIEELKRGFVDIIEKIQKLENSQNLINLETQVNFGDQELKRLGEKMNLSQKRYTKLNPKIMITSTVTGVAPGRL